MGRTRVAVQPSDEIGHQQAKTAIAKAAGPRPNTSFTMSEPTDDGTVTITRSTPAGGDPPQTFRDLQIGIRSEVAKPVPHRRLG
jgi:hypothetical protein